MLPRLRATLRGVGVLIDEGDWLVDEQILACAYPRREEAVEALKRRGVSMLVNLHECAHAPEPLARHGITEVHLPVRDFTPPSPEHLDRGVAAIERALADGQKVAVHCGAGLGRTGTLLACYLVSVGLTPPDAIERVRAARPGSIETREQASAVVAYGQARPRRTEG